MNKKFTYAAIGLVVLLLIVLGVIVFQKSNTAAPTSPITEAATGIKKVNLAEQPEWVQKLIVTAKKGRSANGLTNVTLKVTGMPDGVVESLEYVVQYDTTNRGTQGALSSKPAEVRGKTEFTKVIDLGTCSTKSCVTHEGVTGIEVQLDFLGKNGEKFAWSGSLPLN